MLRLHRFCGRDGARVAVFDSPAVSVTHCVVGLLLRRHGVHQTGGPISRPTSRSCPFRFLGSSIFGLIQPCDSTPMSNSTIKRRRTLVDPEVQGGVLRKIAVHWVMFFVCNAIALMIWIRLFEQPDADWGQTFGDTMRRFLPFFIISMALIPAFAWDTLKLTNRFAGPILRLRSALYDASKGRAVVPLHFRSDDFWQEIATNFNALMDRFDAMSPENADSAAKVDSDDPPSDHS